MLVLNHIKELTYCPKSPGINSLALICRDGSKLSHAPIPLIARTLSIVLHVCCSILNVHDHAISYLTYIACKGETPKFEFGYSQPLNYIFDNHIRKFDNFKDLILANH
jgi:hypothetical protein